MCSLTSIQQQQDFFVLTFQQEATHFDLQFITHHTRNLLGYGIHLGDPDPKSRRIMTSTATDSKRLNLHQNSSIICEITEYSQSGHKVASYVNTKNGNEGVSRIDVLVSTFHEDDLTLLTSISRSLQY